MVSFPEPGLDAVRKTFLHRIAAAVHSAIGESPTREKSVQTARWLDASCFISIFAPARPSSIPASCFDRALSDRSVAALSLGTAPATEAADQAAEAAGCCRDQPADPAARQQEVRRARSGE